MGMCAVVSRKLVPRRLAEATALTNSSIPIAGAKAPWNSGCRTSGVLGKMVTDRASGTPSMIEHDRGRHDRPASGDGRRPVGIRAGAGRWGFKAPTARASHTPATARTASSTAQPKKAGWSDEPKTAISAGAASGTLRCEGSTKTNLTGRARHRSRRIRAKKQIAEGAAQQIVDAAARQMVRPVVDHMAALAEALQVAEPVVAGIMIEMDGGQRDARVPYARRLDDIRPGRSPATVVAPGVPVSIKPASVGQAANCFAVRPATFLAHAEGPLESHVATELRPVDRIEPTHFSPDRHCHPHW